MLAAAAFGTLADRPEPQEWPPDAPRGPRRHSRRHRLVKGKPQPKAKQRIGKVPAEPRPNSFDLVALRSQMAKPNGDAASVTPALSEAG
jgi:hypothetical protein